MTTISKYIVALLLCLCVNGLSAQENEESSVLKADKITQIKKLEELKEFIKREERELLKAEVEAINKRLDNGEISASEAEELKKEVAKKRALNIEDRILIVDSKIELIKRNKGEYNHKEIEDFEGTIFKFGNVISIGSDMKKPVTPKYDLRTTNDLVFAVGFNNTVSDEWDLGDSPYETAGSGFVELGWNWKTRVFKNSNFLRFKYGFSFQWNKLSIKNNQYFVQDGNITNLEEFPTNLKEAEFRITNLVVPIHFEFGPSKKRDYTDRIRYTTDGQFKVGLGAYGGVRLGTQQKLRFDENDDRVKQKIKRNYNASNFVYGLSGYVGIGDFSLYAKYDLNNLFKDQALDQNNISLGLRWDLD